MAIRDIQVALQNRQAQSEPVRGFTIGVLVGIESETSSAVSSKPDYSWVKEFNQGQSTFQILNRAVPNVVGSMVKVGRPEKPPFQRQVIGPYDESSLYPDYDPGDGGSLNSPPHAQSHQYPSEASPGTDVVKVFQPALTILKTETVGGMSVRVRPYIFRYEGTLKTFPGLVIDLTSYIPASATEKRRILLYLDKVTNSLLIGLGIIVVTNPVPFLGMPLQGVASSYVSVENGQTELSMASDVVDARDFLNDGDVLIPAPTQPGDIITADEGTNWAAGFPVLDQFGNIITSSLGIVTT